MTWLMALVDSAMSYSPLTQPLPVSACVMLLLLYPHRPLHSAGKIHPLTPLVLLTYSRPLEDGALRRDGHKSETAPVQSKPRQGKKIFFKLGKEELGPYGV